MTRAVDGVSVCDWMISRILLGSSRLNTCTSLGAPRSPRRRDDWYTTPYGCGRCSWQTRTYSPARRYAAWKSAVTMKLSDSPGVSPDSRPWLAHPLNTPAASSAPINPTLRISTPAPSNATDGLCINTPNEKAALAPYRGRRLRTVRLATPPCATSGPRPEFFRHLARYPCPHRQPYCNPRTARPWQAAQQ
ncbi:Uncharacterised protein [Bordetella pertussis]|nr:Uncharacterised protein [Bordetella pertussis]